MAAIGGCRCGTITSKAANVRFGSKADVSYGPVGHALRRGSAVSQAVKMIFVSLLNPFETKQQLFRQIGGLHLERHLRDNCDLACHVFLALPNVPLDHRQFGFCYHDDRVTVFD